VVCAGPAPQRNQRGHCHDARFAAVRRETHRNSHVMSFDPLVAALVALAAPVLAQTTGRLVGNGCDAQGGVLPGVTVTVTSPQLRGPILRHRFQWSVPVPIAAPGTYTVKADLSGFKTVEQPDVKVSIDQTITLPLKMQVAGVAETVKRPRRVSGGRHRRRRRAASPPARTSSTTAGRADFYGIHQARSGVTQDTYGRVDSTDRRARRNQYIIDGLNTTGVNTGVQGKTLNFDFVQEVEVKTGGLNAEVRPADGRAVNVLTKSGGNTFHGDIFGFGEGGGPAGDQHHRREACPSGRPTTQHRPSRRLRRRSRWLHREGQGLVLRRVSDRSISATRRRFSARWRRRAAPPVGSAVPAGHRE